MKLAENVSLDEAFWLGILEGARHGVGYDLLRGFLAGASYAYCAGLEAYLNLERLGIRRRTKLPIPTISIGNLSSGGTGKTPMTHTIASSLLGAGLRPVILSRGHGGALSHHATQVSDGAGEILHSAAEIGDEAAALAAMLSGVPVYVGKDRRESAALALARHHPDLFLLDDGFQYWQLARDLDIVLIDARRPFDNGYTLPRGLLREPKEHLSRAGIVVITRAALASEAERECVHRAAEELAPDAPVFFANHCFGGFRPLNEPARIAGAAIHALPLCGIAQPEAFRALLKANDISITADMAALPDHAIYDAAVITAIKGKIENQAAQSIVTTEKDAVKLPLASFDLPIYAMTLRIELDRPAEFDEELRKRAHLPVLSAHGNKRST